VWDISHPHINHEWNIKSSPNNYIYEIDHSWIKPASIMIEWSLNGAFLHLQLHLNKNEGLPISALLAFHRPVVGRRTGQLQNGWVSRRRRWRRVIAVVDVRRLCIFFDPCQSDGQPITLMTLSYFCHFQIRYHIRDVENSKVYVKKKQTNKQRAKRKWENKKTFSNPILSMALPNNWQLSSRLNN